jgi:hypothetical protein
VSETATTFEALKAQIASLPANQQEVLGQVCLGNDSGHAKATLKALERKGLVYSYPDLMHFKDGLPPMEVTCWSVEIAVHYAWCSWAAEHVTEEDLADE